MHFLIWVIVLLTSRSIFEFPDVVPPVVTSGSINYTTGIMVVEFSETLSIVGGLMDLSKAFLSNYEPVIYHFIGLAFRRYESDPAQAEFLPFISNWDATEA